ncbi:MULTISPECIES: thioesterase family protein [Caldimonas]|jgi:4-hydroxybenzoyl-CoA thioesterase|uniref:acyl-CoA thioesterase n=1 Tax=Caldimonas TaxID=196013 RepID=UPI00078023F4|nr:thioesterase family protein [Caldimonas taiwanensis]MCX7660733.1 acyl-CoA thioesterase [Caldimonas manganoxidans]
MLMPGIAQRHAFERPQLIRFSHCDPAGLVFFPQYLVMFNQLVEDWFTEALGLPYAEILGPRRTGLPTVSLTCDFIAPSRMGEILTLGLTLQRVGRASFSVDWGARCGDQARVTARQVLVTTSLDTHRSIPIPEDMRRALLDRASPRDGDRT